MVRSAQVRTSAIAFVDRVGQPNGIDEDKEGDSNIDSYLMRATQMGCRLS